MDTDRLSHLSGTQSQATSLFTPHTPLTIEDGYNSEEQISVVTPYAKAPPVGFAVPGPSITALDMAVRREAAKEQEKAVGDDVDAEEEPEDDVVIRFVNTHKTYLLGIEGIPALRGINLEVRRGEFFVLLGQSGSGKTTLLNLIGTIDRPTKGFLELFGRRIENGTKDSSLAKIRLSKIGFVFQTFNLLSSMTAMENVEMPAILYGKTTRPERRKRAKLLLERVGMGGRLKHRPTQMSGGEQQRVTIARAMMNSPSLLVVDEPTGDLDTINSAVVMKLLTDMNERENVTIVMVTHDSSLATFGHRVAYMRDGKIASLEVVPEMRRKQTRIKLEDTLEEMTRMIEIGSDNLERESASQSTAHRDFYSRTDLRSLADYEALAFVAPDSPTSTMTHVFTPQDKSKDKDKKHISSLGIPRRRVNSHSTHSSTSSHSKDHLSLDETHRLSLSSSTDEDGKSEYSSSS